MERKSLIYLKMGILFSFLNFTMGSLNLLPDFAGMLFFYASIQSHERQTHSERKLKPLILILAADYFLHWVYRFENNVEGLLALVISLYVIFVLTGETAERIRREQPDRARQLEWVRACVVLLQSASFLAAPSRIELLSRAVAVLTVVVCIIFIVIICRVRPMES